MNTKQRNVRREKPKEIIKTNGIKHTHAHTPDSMIQTVKDNT